MILADMRRQHAEVAELRREIEGLRGTLPVAKQISELGARLYCLK